MFAYQPIPGQEPLAFDQGLGGDAAVERVPGPGKFHRFLTDTMPMAVQNAQPQISLECIKNRLSIKGYLARLKQVLQLKENHRTEEKVLGIKQMTGRITKELCLAGMQEHRAVGVEQHYDSPCQVPDHSCPTIASGPTSMVGRFGRRSRRESGNSLRIFTTTPILYVRTL